MERWEIQDIKYLQFVDNVLILLNIGLGANESIIIMIIYALLITHKSFIST